MRFKYVVELLVGLFFINCKNTGTNGTNGFQCFLDYAAAIDKVMNILHH